MLHIGASLRICPPFGLHSGCLQDGDCLVVQVHPGNRAQDTYASPLEYTRDCLFQQSSELLGHVCSWLPNGTSDAVKRAPDPGEPHKRWPRHRSADKGGHRWPSHNSAHPKHPPHQLGIQMGVVNAACNFWCFIRTTAAEWRQAIIMLRCGHRTSHLISASDASRRMATRARQVFQNLIGRRTSAFLVNGGEREVRF